MRLWLLVVCLTLSGAVTLAQDGNQAYQQQVDRVQLQRLQQEIEINRMQAQSESMRRDTERIVAEIDQWKRSRPESVSEIMARQNADREAARQASETAAAIENEKLINAAKTADLAYLCIAVFVPLILGFYLARNVKRGVGMKHEEKFGILLTIFAGFFGLVSIAISDGWDPRMDALQNLMLTLRFRLFADSASIYSQAMVDLPTKYVLLTLIAVAAYGFTTYLGATPAWKKTEPLAKPPVQEG